MDPWTLPTIPRNDTLGRYRQRLFYWFTICGVLAVVPFAVYAFYRGNTLQGMTSLLVVSVFFVDGIFMHFGKPPPVPRTIVYGAVIGTLCIAVIENRGIGVLWAYPTLLLFQFVLPPRQANVLNVIMIVIVSALAYYYLDAAYTVRAVVTLVLTLALANVFMNIVQQLQQRLMDQAIIDPLTGVYNRRHFETCIESELTTVSRTGKPSAMLLMDIDLFKKINDQLGHAAGDKVLVDVTKLIHSVIRQSDMLFRIGGEEFVILLPDTDREAAGTIAQKIRATVAGAPLLGDRKITLSIGVGVLRSNEDRRSLLNRCDSALYQAKEEGRNRVEFA